MGIVTAKLDAIRAVRQWGDIPQNVNFAVKAQVARAFLESRGLKYLTARSDLPLADADVADTAKSFTAYIQCKRSSSVETSLAPSLVAQRALLYDEDPSNSKGKQYVGSVVWRTERVKASGGQQSDIAVRADIEVPDRKFKMTMSFRRNTDASLPASHTVELTFILPPDFRGGGIASVPGILMKSNEQARGTPLAGLAVKVTHGFFLVGLSNVEADRVRNIQLLKERSWFDVPLVYRNQRRAIIAIEKGSSGEQTFANAFSVWGETQSTAPPYGDAGRAVKTIPE